MPKELTGEDVALIKSAAHASCLNKGIPERIKNPATKTGSIKNPAFEMCYLKQAEIGMREARSGRMNDWIRTTKAMIREQGGLIGLFEKLGFVSDKIRSGEISEEGKATDENTDGSGDGEKGKLGAKSNAMVWMAIALFLVLVIVLIVFLVKKKKGGLDGGTGS